MQINPFRNKNSRTLTDKEIILLSDALVDYSKTHHVNCDELLEKLSGLLTKKTLTVEEKILAEKIKLATGGKPAQDIFFKKAIDKIREARTVDYAQFRSNFACETLIGVGYCSRKCEQCKLNNVYTQVVQELRVQQLQQIK